VKNNMRDVNAVYDGSLNAATAEQELAAKEIFELVQAVRKAAADGELTPVEILQIALAEVPSAAPVIVNLIRDDVPNEVDAEAVGHVLFKQLY
jgi:hypothetical protein